MTTDIAAVFVFPVESHCPSPLGKAGSSSEQAVEEVGAQEQEPPPQGILPPSADPISDTHTRTHLAIDLLFSDLHHLKGDKTPQQRFMLP